MEPFVPKPEERISHQVNGGTKGRPPKPKAPTKNGTGKTQTFFRNHSYLITPSIIFSLILIVFYSIQQQSIADLEKQLSMISSTASSTKANSTPNSLLPDAPKTENAQTQTSDNDNLELTKEIAALNKQLALQAEHLKTLEQDIENVRTQPGNTNPQGLTAKQHQLALDALKNDLAAVKETFEKKIEQDSAQQALKYEDLATQLLEFNNNVDKSNNQIQGNLAAALIEWQEKATSHERKITAIEQQTDSIGAIEKTLSNLQSQLNSLNSEQNQLSTTYKTTASQLAELKNQFVSFNGYQEGLRTTNQPQADIAPLRDQVKNLSETRKEMAAELATIKKDQNQLIEKLIANQNQLANLDKALTEQKSSAPALVENGLEAAILPLKDQIDTLNKTLQASSTQASSQQQSINRLRNEVAAQLVAIKKDQNQLAAQLAANKNQLATLDTNLSAQKNQAGELTNDAFETTIGSLREKLDGLSSALVTATSKIDAQEKDFDILRTQVNASANQSSDSSISNDALNAVQAQLASQVDDLNKLRNRDAELFTDVSLALKELKSLQGKVAQLSVTTPNSTSSSPELTTKITALNDQVRDLSARFDTTVTKLVSNDSQVSQWQQRIESQLANQPSQNPETQDVQTIKEIIKLLMKQHPYTKFPQIN